MAKTFRDNLQDLGSGIKDDLEKLLLEHSALIYDNLNSGGGVSFIGFGDHRWKELSLEGKRLQNKILIDFQKYKDIVENLVDKTNLAKLKEYYHPIEESIKQEHRSYHRTIQKAFEKASGGLSEIDHLLDCLHSSGHSSLMVVDTNALLINPKIEEWGFDGFSSFTIVLTPTVLSELDEHKFNHRNENVREKASKLIRQIKEYGRRGNLLNGVNIKSNSIMLKSIAVEPDFKNAMPWLDRDNNDDRFIASIYEIIKDNVRSAVYVITADINVQNKARFACLPFLEPPED